MTINVEPVGRLSIPLVKLHDMLAGSLAFQEKIGASTEEEAAERIHLITTGFAPENIDAFDNELPFAVLGWEGFDAERIAFQHFNTTGDLGIAIYHEDKSYSKNSMVEFLNYLGKLIRDFEEATDNAEDNLMLNNFSMNELMVPQEHRTVKWLGVYMTVNYGAQAS